MSLVIITVAAVVSSDLGGGQLYAFGIAYDARPLAHNNVGCCLAGEGSLKAALLVGIHVAIQLPGSHSAGGRHAGGAALHAVSAPSSQALQAAATSAGLEERLGEPIMSIFEGGAQQGEPGASFVGASFQPRQRKELESARRLAADATRRSRGTRRPLRLNAASELCSSSSSIGGSWLRLDFDFPPPLVHHLFVGLNPEERCRAPRNKQRASPNAMEVDATPRKHAPLSILAKLV